MNAMNAIKVYIFNNKLFASINVLIDEMLKTKYCSTVQDCYDDMVYMYSIQVDNNLKNISYGFINTNKQKLLFSNKEYFDEYITENTTKIIDYVWYDDIIIH
jgi:hypothetical protein